MTEELRTIYKAKEPFIFEAEQALINISGKFNSSKNFDQIFFLSLGKIINDDIEKFNTTSTFYSSIKTKPSAQTK